MTKPQNITQLVIRRESALRSDDGRSNFESLWQQIARLCIPRKATFRETISPGQERTRYIFDSTAPRSLELFASFLHTLMNNPASFWFGLVAKRNGEAISNPATEKWLETVRDIMLEHMTRQSANIYTHLHQIYLSLGAFGTGVSYVDSMRNLDDDLRIAHYHLNDIVFDVDAHDQVHEVHRQFEYTAEQAKERWPDANLGPGIEKELRDGKPDRRKFKFIHSVIPNTPRVRAVIPTRFHNALFISVWVNKTDQKTVSVGSFEEFPYQVPRWYVEARERYGRSPAMTVLPDIRMINRMKDTMIRGLEKIVDPPLLLPDGGMISPIRLSPGSISFSDGAITPQQLIPTTGAGINLGQFEIGKVQEIIREGFFIPLFITPESPVKTATQVLQEADERNRAVSPMLVRQQAELFDPLIRRIFFVLQRAGAFPAAPAGLNDVIVDVQYNSPLIASQKQAESLGTVRLIEALQLYAASTQSTDVFDILDPDEVAKVFHEGSAAPARILRDETDLKNFRDAMNDNEDSAEALQAGIAGAGAVADLVKAGAIPGAAQAA